MLKRTTETKELLINEPKCFLLLTLIAFRAKRTNEFSALNLEIGEALIGDNGDCGLTSREYRTTKEKLEKWNFATFKATNKGTIAKIIDKRVFDINEEQSDNQTDKPKTSKRQASDNPKTTNNNDKNEKNDNKKRSKFKKPSLSELKSYMEEKSYKDFSENFFDFYESKGWKVGKNPMKDWKSAVRGWVSRDQDLKKPEKKKVEYGVFQPF